MLVINVTVTLFILYWTSSQFKCQKCIDAVGSVFVSSAWRTAAVGHSWICQSLIQQF